MDQLKRSGCGLGFMALWLAFWALITLGADAVLAYCALRQCWAYTYASTQGTVLRTNITSSTDSEGGTSYTPEVKYAFQVGGVKYNSDRISYLFVSSSSKAANDVLARFPVGKPTTVYYNPASPGDSVLLRGIDGMGLFVGIFFLPFNVIMLVMWYGMFSHLGPGKPIRRWLHFQSRDDGLAARLTIYTTPPLVAFLIGAGAAGFCLSFVIGFGMTVWPVMWLAVPGWIVVLVVSMLSWRAALGWARRLEVDRLTGKMTIHQKSGSRNISAAEVREIAVDGSSTTDSEGHVKSSYATCLVCTAKEGEERIELCTFASEDLSQWVRDWVGEKLRKESGR